MKAAREFISDIAEHLSMPEVYKDIRRLIEQPDASIEDFVRVIETDSSLSFRVIQIARSDFFGFPRKTKTLYEAISLIGVMQMHDMLLSCLCIRTLTSIPEEIFNIKAFWSYSVDCAIASRIIALHSAMPASNHFFTLGLLHNVGQAAMFVREPDITLQILDDCQQQEKSISEIEKEYLGFDYGQLGCALMQLWHLPSEYQQVASHHRQPAQAHLAHRQAVHIVHLAHNICENKVAGNHQSVIADTAASDEQLNCLPQNIDDIVIEQINMHSETVLGLLLPQSVQGMHG
jgi:HD-like signal output (HDOD) protein